MSLRSTARLALTLAIVAGATLALVPCHWFALRTGLLSRACAPRLWNRAILRALGWRVNVRGGMAAGRPLLLVSNHVSWSDIMVLSAHGDVTFIAKSEVGSWPLLGALARLQGTVFVERGNKRSVGAQAAAIAERLKRGDALVLFPEGTTADGNRVLPFKSSLFGALDLSTPAGGAAGVTVQPVAIAYAGLHGLPMSHAERAVASWIGDQSLPAHLRLLARHGPLDVTLLFGEPLRFGGGDDRKAVARRAEAAVRAMMARALRG